MNTTRNRKTDTYAAIVTPVGEGGIGVVAVVGLRALQAVAEIFKGKCLADLKDACSGKLYYGHIVDEGNVIDEVIVGVFRSGESLFGHDLVEINCHGGIVCVNQVMQALARRHVEPGSWQALLEEGVKEGRLHCVQQEALEKLVEAKTELAARFFLAQYEGALSKCIGELEAELKVAMRGDAAREKLESAEALLARLASSARVGSAFSELRLVVVCGETNVGKSSLVNALVKQSRVLVHEEPGTTRDAVEVIASADGLPIRLIDTAGLRETKDQVEIISLCKTHQRIAGADLLLALFDHSRPLTAAEEHFARELPEREVLVVVNKSDLPHKLDYDLLRELVGQAPCSISALQGQGIVQLAGDIKAQLLGARDLNLSQPMIFTHRQRELVEWARKELTLAAKQTNEDSESAVCAHLKNALGFLEEMLSAEELPSVEDRRKCLPADATQSEEA